MTHEKGRMKNLALLTVLILLSNGLFGQAEKTIILFSYQNSNCNHEENIERIQNRVVGLNWIGDTCTLVLSVVQNCCLVNNGHVDLQHDTLFLTTDSKTLTKIKDKGDTTFWIEETPCMCFCHFILTFKIGGLNIHKAYLIYLNGNKLEDKLNNYLPAEYSLTKYDTIYKYDNSGFSYKYGYYVRSGKVHDYLKIKPGNYEYKEFYENGRLKKHCIRFNKTPEKEMIDNCTEWTKRGRIKINYRE